MLFVNPLNYTLSELILNNYSSINCFLKHYSISIHFENDIEQIQCLSSDFSLILPEIDDKKYINGLNSLSTFLNPNKMFKPRPSSLWPWQNPKSIQILPQSNFSHWPRFECVRSIQFTMLERLDKGCIFLHFLQLELTNYIQFAFRKISTLFLN